MLIWVTITLIAMILMGDLLSNISLLGWMFFHNCFASLQDVVAMLAVDILLPEEQEEGKWIYVGL